MRTRMKPHPALLMCTFAAVIAVAGCGSTTVSNKEGTVMSLDQTKDALRGEWVSIAPEIRPSATKNPDGTLKPFYLTRNFKYLGNDRFELTINNSADPYGKAQVARIYLRGHMHWKGDHPIAAGAQKVDFVADQNYQGPPPAPPLPRLLNKGAGAG